MSNNMIKCQQCRNKDVELLTRWERFCNWLFYKVNYTFFADDFEDLKTQKYTQGFSDGNVTGFKQGKTERKISSLKELFPTVPYNPKSETEKVDYQEEIEKANAKN